MAVFASERERSRSYLSPFDRPREGTDTGLSYCTQLAQREDIYLAYDARLASDSIHPCAKWTGRKWFGHPSTTDAMSGNSLEGTQRGGQLSDLMLVGEPLKI